MFVHNTRAVMSQVVVFLHIPKTGGTTLNYILQNVYRWQFLWLRNDIIRQESRYILPIEMFFRIPEHKRKKFKAIAGHQIQPLLDHFHENFSFFLARNPYQQLPSLYFHHQRGASDSPSNKLIRSYETLEEFLKSQSDYYPNPQTRSLLNNDAKILRDTNLARNKIYDFVWNQIDLCGPTEKLESFIDILASKLSWSNFTFSNKNIGNWNDYQLTNQEIELIKERNVLDQYLYEQVCKKFGEVMKSKSQKASKVNQKKTSFSTKLIMKIQQYQLAHLTKMSLKNEVKYFPLYAIKKKISHYLPVR